jgi:hypothetical protein
MSLGLGVDKYNNKSLYQKRTKKMEIKRNTILLTKKDNLLCFKTLKHNTVHFEATVTSKSVLNISVKNENTSVSIFLIFRPPEFDSFKRKGELHW